ncbi:MAG: cupin-like domain-containing protein [Pseudomonadota bacterium]
MSQTAPLARSAPQGPQDRAPKPAPVDMAYAPEDVAIFRAAFPDRPCTFRHPLVGHPLLSLEALQALAPKLPGSSHEFHSGQIDPSQPDPDVIPGTGRNAFKTLEDIEAAEAWMSLRSVQLVPEYAALTDSLIASLGAAAMLPGGRTHLHESFIFVSSPATTTPFHFDPEYNVLMQIEGEKTVHVFPVGDREMVRPQDEEELHATGKCNVVFDEARFQERAQTFVLNPGDALYMPVKAPHWVQNGPSTSISFSATWRSAATDVDRRVHLFNRALRKRGITPSAPGAAPRADQAKAFAYRLLERLGGGRVAG